MRKLLKCMMIGAMALAVMSQTGNYSEAASSRQISITQKNFPSKDLRKELRKSYDKNKDGKLSKAEIKGIKYLNVDSKKSKSISLKGVQYFTNLRSLDLYAVNVKSIDLSKNKKLRSLNLAATTVRKIKLSKNLHDVYFAVEKMPCTLDFHGFKKLDRIHLDQGHYNKLNVSDSSVRLIAQGNYPVALKNILAQNCKKLRSVDLEVSQLKKVNLNGTNGLRVLKLNCSGSIKKLNVSKMKNLQELRVGGSKITTLSVKKNKKLEELDISDSKISKMDLSANKKLKVLRYRNTKVSKMLSVPNPSAIEELDCSETKISSLDLRKYTALKHLNASQTKITSLNVQNCRELVTVYVRGTIKLSKLDLSNQAKLRDVTFGDSGIKELDVRNSLLICDQDDLGSGFDFMTGFKISCKIIVNKNWKELNYYQNQAKECGFNITWQIV